MKIKERIFKAFYKQLPSIRDLISEEKLNYEIFNEKERIEEEERKVNRSKMVYKASNVTYDFKIRNNIIDTNMANDE